MSKTHYADSELRTVKNMRHIHPNTTKVKKEALIKEKAFKGGRDGLVGYLILSGLHGDWHTHVHTLTHRYTIKSFLCFFSYRKER